jgi:DNA-binding GntR family transcriptional regulator
MYPAPLPIERRSLADIAEERLRTWIVEGRLAADHPISEPLLAQLLGVSRTPVRAAIARLVREGMLSIDSKRALHVVPADELAVREVYPILGALEAMAVRLSADSPPEVAALREINGAIRAGKAKRVRLFELDREFHRLLVANCPNKRLIALLEEHRRLGSRFDGAARRGMYRPAKSAAEHAAIIDDIARGRFDAAARRIEQHYLEGIDTVIAWLEARKETR